MPSINVPSGARVVINTAPWKDAKILKQAVQREVALSAAGFGLETLFLVDSSEAVDIALQPCLIRCTYNDEKITDQTFDSLESRADYYDIRIACLKENLGPLWESLRLKLSELGLLRPQAPPAGNQKQE